MKYTFLAFIGLFFSACGEPVVPVKDALEAARVFVSATLRGDMDKAQSLLLRDSVNDFILKTWHKKYLFLSEAEKLSYKGASILIHKDSTVNDSVHIIRFSNTHKKIPDNLKIIRDKDRFLVDLKYTFCEDTEYFSSIIERDTLLKK